MLFNSFVFLFAFLPITYFVFWRLRDRQHRYIWLTLTGYVFYGTWNYRFCALLAFSTIVSYCAGLGMLKWNDPRRRRLCLVVPITVDLLLLGTFKYVNFALHSASVVADWLRLPGAVHAPAFDIVLPVGISFYTFHTITYVVDSYRGTIKPTRNFFEFACYVSLFSQLVAGPIVRFRQIENDLEHLDTAERTGGLDIGWSYFAIGMMKKVLIADTLARVINPALADYTRLSTLNTWLCVLGYTYQIYFDFYGYSDMAVGLGHMFGLRLPQNFNSPYKALDMRDFWRRWHISLSTCLRDYLYIPLGGSRGARWRQYRNLIITMLLGGLWHGANWTFVFWGGYHGLLLAFHRAFGDVWTRLHPAFRRAATFFLVIIGWVFFRADNFPMAFALLDRMFSWRAGPPMAGSLGLALALAVAIPVAHLAPNTWEIKHAWRPAWVAAFCAGYLACLFLMAGSAGTPFLYFQF